MPFCEVVASVGHAIAAARHPVTAREAYLLYVLRGMPLYRDVNRLDLWEYAYNQVAPDEAKSITEQMIDIVFELGAENLYGAFEESITRRVYRDVLSSLAAQGIIAPEDPD